VTPHDRLNQLMGTAPPGKRWDGAAGQEVPYHPVLGAESGPLAELIERQAAPITAVPTPWPAWSEACRGRGGRVGFAKGWVVMVAARSGFGKSLVASCIAARGMEEGEPVAFHTLEMFWDDLAVRTMAMVSGEDAGRMDPGPFFCRETITRAAHAMDAMKEATGGYLCINEKPIRKLGDVTDGIRRQHDGRGSILQIVDYLQLAKTAGRNQGINDRITEVADACMDTAAQLGVTLVALSQFNRETSASPEKPHKEGMMGGSSLENDSTQTILLDHSRQWKNPTGWHGFALLAKNRCGPEVEIPIHMDYRTLRVRQDPEALLLDAASPARSAATGRRRS
jgi:replicative DNA helicase